LLIRRARAIRHPQRVEDQFDDLVGVHALAAFRNTRTCAVAYVALKFASRFRMETTKGCPEAELT
jgi:hypothetical protein